MFHHLACDHLSVFTDPCQPGTCNIGVSDADYGHAQGVNFHGEIGHSTPDVDPDQTEAEWKIFRRIMLVKFKNSAGDASSAQHVMSSLVTNDTLTSGFPNLGKLATMFCLLQLQLWKEHSAL